MQEAPHSSPLVPRVRDHLELGASLEQAWGSFISDSTAGRASLLSHGAHGVD